MFIKQLLQLEKGSSGIVLLTDISLKQVDHTNPLLVYSMVLVATEWVLEVPVYVLKESLDMAYTVQFPFLLACPYLETTWLTLTIICTKCPLVPFM